MESGHAKIEVDSGFEELISVLTSKRQTFQKEVPGFHNSALFQFQDPTIPKHISAYVQIGIRTERLGLTEAGICARKIVEACKSDALKSLRPDTIFPRQCPRIRQGLENSKRFVIKPAQQQGFRFQHMKVSSGCGVDGQKMPIELV